MAKVGKFEGAIIIAMREAVDVLKYTYLDGELCTSLTTNVQVLESDLNLAFTVARLISVQSQLRTDEDWKEIRFIFDKLCKEFSRHVALHSFMPYEGLICVPTPGLRWPHVSVDLELDEAQLKARHALAEEFNCISYGLEDRLSEFPGALHVDPDFIMISFRNYEPFFSFGEALYYGLFLGPQEKWNYYTVPEMPSNIKLSHVKGIMLSGGKYTAAERETAEWMPTIKQFINRVYQDFPQIKFFGHCLGAQVLAASLGGVVDKDPEHFFICGPEAVRLTDAGQAELKGMPLEFKITELHRDYIVSLPPMGVLYGISDSCPVEVWGVPGRVLGLQGHSEFPAYILSHYISEYSYKTGDIEREAADIATAQAQAVGSYGLSTVKALYAWYKSK